MHETRVRVRRNGRFEALVRALLVRAPRAGGDGVASSPVLAAPIRARHVRIALACALVCVLVAGAAAAQDDPEPDADPTPGLASFGVAVGFPSYQTVSASAALQSGFVGMAVRAGYGPGAGAYGGVTLRGYPPVAGLPVPVWIGAGAGVGGGGVVPHAAAGAHVPVARRWRVDVEAGAAWPRLGLERTTVPHLAVGVSYAFAVELPEGRRSEESPAVRSRSATADCEPGPPDAGGLDPALDRAVGRFVADARATYGSLYRDLDYRIDVVDREVEGDDAVLTVGYAGSAVEIASGERTSASGTATVTFRWDGCGWRQTGLDY